MLQQRVMLTSSPWVRAYARAIRSPPAFAAAYGEFGSSRASSAHDPVATLPYTSSVDTCTTRGTPASRHACSSTWVPTTFVVTKSAAPAIDRSTCVSAAKLTTMSCPGTTVASSPASQMSPRTKVSPGLSVTGSRLARFPA